MRKIRTTKAFNFKVHCEEKAAISRAAAKMAAVVILDSDQVPEGISKKFVRYPGEKQADFYNRVTHLHHQSQR